MLQRSNRPVKAIVKAGIRYATCAKVWKHLGYDKTPVLGDPVREPERAGEIRKLTFMYRELFCMFVGGVINMFTYHVNFSYNIPYCRERSIPDANYMLGRTATLLPDAVQKLCETIGLNFAKEDLAYYKKRIDEYAASANPMIQDLFCNMYDSVIEPSDNTFHHKVSYACSWLDFWYMNGDKALK